MEFIEIAHMGVGIIYTMRSEVHEFEAMKHKHMMSIGRFSDMRKGLAMS
jgi:hypothetical protein